MNFSGKIQNIQRDWKSGQFTVNLTVNEPHAINEINSLCDCDKLSIDIKKWRKKRSLDANAYCWYLITKIAEKLKSSKEEVYEEFIQKYSPCYEDDEGVILITVLSYVDMSKVKGHWKFLKKSSDGKFSSYLMLKGSSEFDTAEMSAFIDQVIYEANDLGIETATYNELERMKATWQSAKAY